MSLTVKTLRRRPAGADRKPLAASGRYWSRSSSLRVSRARCLATAKVNFDYNLLNLQSPNLPSVVYAKKLSADKSLLFGAVVADNVDEAVALEKKIRALTNVVEDVESTAGYLQQEQGEKLKLISEIKQTVAPLQFRPPDMRPVDIYALSSTLYSFHGYLGAARAAMGNSDPALSNQFKSLQNTVEDLRKAMLAGDETALSEHAEKLAGFQQGLFDSLRQTFVTLQNQDDSAPLSVDDLPPALRDRFVGVNGKFLLQVFPRKDVWQRENQEEFVKALRTALDPRGHQSPDHHRHAGAIVRVRIIVQGQLCHGGLVFAGRDCLDGSDSFSQFYRGAFWR